MFKLIGVEGEDVNGGELVGRTAKLKPVNGGYLFFDVFIMKRRETEVDGVKTIKTKLGNTYKFRRVEEKK